MVPELKFQEFRKELKNLEKIGKGWRGIVYRAIWKGKTVAVKVANRPESRKAIQKEAKILEHLKGKSGYPQIMLSGEDFFVYNFIKGKTLNKANLENVGKKKRLYRYILEKAFELDMLGIRKNEFGYLGKNVLIDEKGEIYMIDFERGMFSERPSNLTQFMQLLVREGFLNREEALSLGKRYRHDKEGVFKEILKRLK